METQAGTMARVLLWAKGSIFDDFKSHPQTHMHEKCEKDPTIWSVVKAHLILQSVRSQICSYSMGNCRRVHVKEGKIQLTLMIFYYDKVL